MHAPFIDGHRRDWFRRLGGTGLAAAVVGLLPSLAGAQICRQPPRKQRLVWLFSPNGVVPEAFWPNEVGTEFSLPKILEPLQPWQDQMLVLKGVDNQIRGDGDDHMRGMSCLLTAIELFPGNIQGGGNTPAGWPRGHSIDQELKRFLQSREASNTRFGSLELGVLVPHSADVWTRWVYSGPNRPVTPLSDPKRLFEKLYGDPVGARNMGSVLDAVAGDLQRLRQRVSSEDRRILEEHLQWVQESEVRLQEDAARVRLDPPKMDPTIRLNEENMPQISQLQQELLVAAFQSDQARVATLQYDKSVGNIRMKFLGIEEGHHELSHDPDQKTESVEKLVKINHWYCQQVASLVEKLSRTPEPGGEGTLLDHTTVIWTNELGKGNSHTLRDIPFVLVGGGAGFQMGRSHHFKRMPHNRLWLSLAHGLGHELSEFGKPELCRGGIIDELMA